MPKFGEYETVDEPLRITEEPLYIITLWKARLTTRPSADSFLIKCLQPRRHGTATGERAPTDTLERDLGLEFLESVKLLKRAHSESPQVLAPIHQFGTSDMGAWYATDFYQRRSLKEYISLQGGVESRALAHVVHSVVSGCLALQRATGRSHANLKPSNVLLAGTPCLLRKTPLHLIDPRPSSAIRPTGSSLGDLRAASGSPQEIAELRDLRAIGELVLQLVEGRNIRSGYDYNYPVAPSPPWSALGKDADRWRDLCNRLLKPHLSLAEVSLETLAKEFRPAGVRLPGIAVGAGVVGVVCLAALGVLLFRSKDTGGQSETETTVTSSRPADSTNTAMAANREPETPPAMDPARQQEESRRAELERWVVSARQAERNQDWKSATNAWSQAGQLADALPDANQHQTARQALEYARAMLDGESSLQQDNFEGARQQANRALALRPEDLAAKSLLNRAELKRLAAVEKARQAEQAKQALAAQAELDKRRQDLDQLIASAEQFSRDKRWGQATNAFTQALRQAQQLKATTSSETARKGLAFAQAMDLGEKSLQARNADEAAAQATRASTLKPGDPAATALAEGVRTLRTELAQEREQERKRAEEQELNKKLAALDERITSAGQISQRREWARATNAWAEVLQQARELQQPTRRNTAQKELDFAQAMDLGEKSLQARNADEAAAQATRASTLKPGDPAATALAEGVRTLRTELAQEREQERKRAEEQELNKKLAALDERITSAGQISQRREWGRATNAWAEVLQQAGELQQPARRDTAQKELDFAQAMDLGEKALQARNADEAATQATRASTLKPGDPAATALAEGVRTLRTELAQEREQERKRAEEVELSKKLAALDERITSAGQVSQRREWGRATNAWAEVLQQAGELQQPARRDTAQKELDFAQAMDLGEKSLQARNADEAAAQATRASTLKPGDPAATALAEGVRTLRTELAQEREQERKRAEEVAQSVKGPQSQLVSEREEQAPLARAPEPGTTPPPPANALPVLLTDNQPVTRQVDLARHDQLLEHWEYLFQLKRAPRDMKVDRIGSLSKEMRAFCLSQLEQIEADYQAAGRADRDLRRRVDALRRRIGTGSLAPTPPLFSNPTETYIAPVRR